MRMARPHRGMGFSLNRTWGDPHGANGGGGALSNPTQWLTPHLPLLLKIYNGDRRFLAGVAAQFKYRKFIHDETQSRFTDTDTLIKQDTLPRLSNIYNITKALLIFTVVLKEKG